MEQILTEAAKQAPALVVLAVIVWAFLKDRKSDAESNREFHKNEGQVNRAAMERIVGDHKEVMREQAKSNDRLTESHAVLTRTLLLHDATVRGSNDNVMGSHEEIMGRVGNQ